MQGGKNWILPKDIPMETGSSETLIGRKSGKTTNVPLWERLE
jgi:hypothetical protein